jgi:clan AA aspartic protease
MIIWHYNWLCDRSGFMGADIMGRVAVTAKIESLSDLFKVNEGSLSAEAVRTVEVTDALVDTGATYLCLPPRIISQLGLRPVRKRRIRTAGGPTDVSVYEPVRLTVQGRDCTIEVASIAEDCPVLIGQIPLEIMDFVVDPKGQRLIGNPEHGGEWMGEIFSYFPPT